jgi:phosphate transport system substrate-binding protein
MYTKGPAQGTAKAFIEYMMSDEVKSMIQQMGYIPISDMKISR